MWPKLNRNLLGVMLIVMVVASAIGWWAGPMPAIGAPAEQIKLRFSTEYSTGAIMTDVIKEWMEAVEKRSNERVKFDTFWGGSLTKAGEGFPNVQKGFIDLSVFAIQNHPAQLLLNQVFFAVPFGPKSILTLEKAVSILYQEAPVLNAEFEMFNQKLLFIQVGHGYDLFSNKPIRTVADLKGKKIAISGVHYPIVFKAAGAVPMSLAFAERGMGLQSGIIDAVTCYPTAVVDWGWTGFGKYYTRLGMGHFPWPALTINATRWKGLSKDIQDIMIEEGKKAAHKAAELIEKREVNEGVRTIKEKGIEVYEFSEADLAAWMKDMPEVPLMWIKDTEKVGRPGRMVVEKYMKAAEDAGHKWPKKWKLQD